MKDLLTGKVLLISGGTQGLGAGIARAAAREGATLVLAGRNAGQGNLGNGACLGRDNASSREGLLAGAAKKLHLHHGVRRAGNSDLQRRSGVVKTGFAGQ